MTLWILLKEILASALCEGQAHVSPSNITHRREKIQGSHHEYYQIDPGLSEGTGKISGKRKAQGEQRIFFFAQ